VLELLHLLATWPEDPPHLHLIVMHKHRDIPGRVVGPVAQGGGGGDGAGGVAQHCITNEAVRGGAQLLHASSSGAQL
jgi:hypothetical protein